MMSCYCCCRGKYIYKSGRSVSRQPPKCAPQNLIRSATTPRIHGSLHVSVLGDDEVAFYSVCYALIPKFTWTGHKPRSSASQSAAQSGTAYSQFYSVLKSWSTTYSRAKHFVCLALPRFCSHISFPSSVFHI